MNKNFRQIIPLLLVLCGCAGASTSKYFSSRIRKANYSVLKLEGEMRGQYIQRHLLLKTMDRYPVHGFNAEGGYYLVVDSDQRSSKDIACTFVKVDGRSRILDWMSEEVYRQNQGKPWDLYLKGEGRKLFLEEISEAIQSENLTHFYWEEREENDESQFVCAAAIFIKTDLWTKVTKKLKEGIKKEFFHLNTDSLNIGFPASEE